jgi:ubiquitin fusion degradation protein 1
MLARLQVDYPMLFRLEASPASTPDGMHEIYDVDAGTPDGIRRTHCGVLEFTAEEGCVYIPYWMMRNLNVSEGQLVTVSNVSLPKATFCKLQPQSVDFINEISNPRAVLEHALRTHSCITIGDIVTIPYNDKKYDLRIQEVKPGPAACIIETDCQVDFDAPVGYQEPAKPNGQNEKTAPTGVNGSRVSSAPSSGNASMYSRGASSVGDASDAGSAMDIDADGKPKTRIVDGVIVRPDDDLIRQAEREAKEKLLAPTIGQTGVQKNAAIPESAPTVDYWAVNAGDGSRLDGKAATPLRDTAGNTIDIRALRAEAAARRIIVQQEAASASSLAKTTGLTLNGKPPSAPSSGASDHPDVLADPVLAAALASVTSAAAPVSKRKPRLGSKYSKLKSGTTTFGGSANALDEK